MTEPSPCETPKGLHSSMVTEPGKKTGEAGSKGTLSRKRYAVSPRETGVLPLVAAVVPVFVMLVLMIPLIAMIIS